MIPSSVAFIPSLWCLTWQHSQDLRTVKGRIALFKKIPAKNSRIFPKNSVIYG